ncbi:MAG: hypothetical protein ACREQF_03845 [Candidatus Binataceae bacterium]
MVTADGEQARRELPRYFYRLPLHAQRTYLQSEAIESYALNPSAPAMEMASALERALESRSLARVGDATRALAQELCRQSRVATVPIEVRGVRPHNARGELHGIYYESERRGVPGRIVLWMKTAKRHDVVKPRTFLRTLLHELGHYFDYSLLGLHESFHTQGFFKRESSLMKRLVGDADGRRSASDLAAMP